MTETSRMREAISRQKLLSTLKEPYIEFLVDSGTERTLAADEPLFRLGDPAAHFYLLYSGTVILEVPAIQGPNLVIQKLGAEQVLGWSWLIPPYQWSFQARAGEDAEYIEFDGQRVRERCEQDPDFGYAILLRFASLMSERLEAARMEMMRQWNPPGFA